VVLVVIAVVMAVVLPPVASSAPAAAVGLVPRPCAGRLCAGAARADITPQVTTPMWGYSARAAYSQPERWLAQHTRAIDTDAYQKSYFLRSEGIHTRLYARALLIRNKAGVELALVQVDLGAMTGEMWRAVAEQVAPLGITRDHLLISATHTHGGPGAIQQPPAHGLLVGDNYDPRVVKRTVDGIVKAISDAQARLGPARVAIGQGRLVGASANRSLQPHIGDPCPDPAAVNDGTTCDHNPGGESPLSPHAINPIMTMVRADRTDGIPLGAWTSFAIHGTVFGADNLLFTGDNQGIAERLVEQGIAARAAARGIRLPQGWQIVDAYANGTEGDIAPHCVGYNDFSCAEQTGTLQAKAQLGLYDSLGTQLRNDLPLDARLDVLYMDGGGGTSPVAILGAGPDCPLGRPPFDMYPLNDPIPGQGRKCPFLPLTGMGPQWFWIQVMRIGDYVLANVPGEMTVQMGRRLRQRVLASAANRGPDGKPVVNHALIVGLANDYMSYLTTPEEYDYQYYEGTFTLWGRQEGPLMAERIGALSDRMLRGQPGPSFLEPPDTSGTQADNVSPATQAVSLVPPNRAPGTIVAQPPPSVRRGDVVTSSWVGGQPSVEVTPNEAFVTTQHWASRRWQTVFTDESFQDITDYARDGVEDHWDTRWDVPLDAPAGAYRFVVTGKAYVDGVVRPYAVTSSTFRVIPNGALAVTGASLRGGAVLVRAAYPAPDPKVNFRLRAAGPTTGKVTVTVTRSTGATRTASGRFDPGAGAYVVATNASPGDRVTVASGGLVDGYGNANGTAFSATP
jgi:neutral ceramidase